MSSRLEFEPTSTGSEVSMDKELARHIVRTAFRSSGDLEELVPLLRHHCGEEEARTYEWAIAGAIADIHRELTVRVFASFPELESRGAAHHSEVWTPSLTDWFTPGEIASLPKWLQLLAREASADGQGTGLPD